MNVERVSQERERRLLLLAQALESDLRLIGLDVTQAGDYFSGAADLRKGFVVFYDPSASDDESAGVFCEVAAKFCIA